MVDRTASDVFLTLWRYHARGATSAEADAATFLLCAEAWEKIRRMEETQAPVIINTAPYPVDPEAMRDAIRAAKGEKSTQDEGEKVHADAEKKYTEYIEYNDTSSAAAAAPSPQGEGTEVVQNGPRKESPWEKYRSNCQTRLLASRFSSAEIAKASDGGCTLDNVQAFLMDRHAVGTVTIGAIMKAMDKLEGKT